VDALEIQVVESGSGMIELKRDRTHNFRETDFWFQRRGGQRASPNRITHITFQKRDSYVLLRGYLNPE
jgi:hypothetical protein